VKTSPLPLSSLVDLNNPIIFLAGEGSKRERGLCPLSKSLPLSNKGYFGHK
jgi:hypothetical protein